MEIYVERGYVEFGYVEGGLNLPDKGSRVPVRFFLTMDVKSVTGSEVGQSEIGVVLSPVGGISALIVDGNVIRVGNGIDLSSIDKRVNAGIEVIDGEVNEAIYEIRSEKNDAITEINNVLQEVNDVKEIVQSNTVNVSFTLPDGTILANPIVEVNGNTATFSVPPELAGIEYKVVMTFGEKG